MDVERDIQLHKDLPESIVLRLVVEQVSLAVSASVLKVAEKGTMEAKLLDTAAEFLASLGRVVHGETGEGTHAVRVVFDLASDPVFGLGGDPLRVRLFGDALDTRDGQRHNSVADTVGIRELDTLTVGIANLAHVTLSGGRSDVELGLADGLLLQTSALIGLLKCDLSEYFESRRWKMTGRRVKRCLVSRRV